MYDGYPYTREHQPLMQQEEAGFGGGLVTVRNGRIVWDNSTRSIYLHTITASIRRMVLSGPDADALATGSAIEEVTGWE